MVQQRGGNHPEMATPPSLILRMSIVLGMMAAVFTVLYFSPLPDQNFKSCDRPCHSLDWPMICRVKFSIEARQNSLSCQDCPNNSSSCHSFCLNPDSRPKDIITVNNQFPGPSIQVCQNDIIIVDVINKIPGRGISVHWKGQPNHEAPFMDGVPMVTQCPVSSYTTFQYKFRASSPGTHFYHAYSYSDSSSGLFGGLVVRQAGKMEPHRKLYDVDSKEHLVLLSEWSDEGEDGAFKTILVNGKAGFGSASTVFKVHKGKRYRFRVAYVAGELGCPIKLSIDSHLLKIIALDGNSINPYEVAAAELSKGERLDFVLRANQEPGTYFLRASSNCSDTKMTGLSLITYEGFSKGSAESKPHGVKNTRLLSTSLCDSNFETVCLEDVPALDKMEPELKKYEVDRKFYLGFDYERRHVGTDNDASRDLNSKACRINNLTFTYPPSPLLTQPGDVPSTFLCNEMNIPKECVGRNVCECVHVEQVVLGSTVELILIDQGGDRDENIFHLHGYRFHVVGSRSFDRPLSKDDVKSLDAENKLVKRNLANPVQKDTIRVPKYGVVVLRFIANNPGFWMLRDELSKEWTRGMDLVFQVGNLGDMVSTPSNFPTCGNYIGPDFFLI